MASEPMDIASSTEPPTSTNPPSTSQGSKKRSHSHSKSQQPTKTLTLRNPPWSYIRLQQYHHPQPSGTLDALTAHIQITAALHQFLGVHGAAVPVDVLRLEGSEVWIRVPAEDRSALVAAVGGWVGRAGEGWRVMGWSSWGAGAEGAKDGGRELFGN
jgi:ribonuclease P/MRP protein subunit POP8